MGAQALELRVCAGGVPQLALYSLGLVIGGAHSILIGEGRLAQPRVLSLRGGRTLTLLLFLQDRDQWGS